MNKLSGKALIILAFVLSLATAGLVYSYLKNMSVKPPEHTNTVVVATKNIGAKTRITGDMIQEAQAPVNYTQPGAISESKLVVGTLARDPIAAGEQITERRLVIEGKTGGFTGIIPPDKRAVTVAVTEVSGVAGFVKPGDMVDVVVTFDQSTAGDNVGHMILQNILVLASNRDSEAAAAQTTGKEKEVTKTSTVTLAVAPDDAAKLALAEDKGKVRLALRPFLPAMAAVFPQAVTPKDLVGVQTGSAPVGEVKPDASDRQAAPPAGKGIMVIRGSKQESVPIQ